MPLMSRFLIRCRGESSVVGEHPSSQPPDPLSVAYRLEVGGSPASDSGRTPIPRCYTQTAWDLRSSMPSTCRWLGPEDVKLVGEHPVAAGGFANIWQAIHDGRKVVLKSYRRSMSFDVAQVIARYRNEVHVWSLLHHRDTGVVPLIGMYSTETHPFGLVYECMDGLDLKQYLKKEPNVRRLKLLTEIVRCLKCMHDLGVVHDDLQTANILINKDSTPRISGLGNAHILPQAIAWAVEGGASNHRLSRCRAPELTGPGMSPSVTDATHPTKASDMYAFGVMAWEVLTGQPPFFEMTEIAATYSMLSGARPPRPSNHHEISDRVWRLIERCWHNVPSERILIGEAVTLLETELRCTSDSRALSRA